ncbi:putative Kunitz-type serine protease inhibitor [Mycteria americana]|uniref:putative Kunitz-type serine protease inhibitor n=1 Tax=Mycteria americana TaxID=33587 RepID=UPI003F583E5F
MAPGRLLPLLLLLLPAAAAIDARPGPNGSPLLELCSLPKVVGRCRASMPRWWFNVTGGSCQSFVFGGCEGNANNFLTERECRESCVLGGASKKPGHRAKQTDADSTYDEHCAVPRVTGPCRASFLRWYYSPANQTCRQFIYGGCRGNKNNYQNEEECLSRCGPKPEDTGGTGADFHGDFLSTEALALGVLLAILAAILLGYVTDVTLKTCRRKPELPAAGMGWSPGDDKEYLMSNAYTL